MEWVEKLEGEKLWRYFARVFQKAISKSCPIAFRKGGGMSLVLRGAGVGPPNAVYLIFSGRPPQIGTLLM